MKPARDGRRARYHRAVYLTVWFYLASLMASIASLRAEVFEVDNASVNGTSGDDRFEVRAGRRLSLDAGFGLDTLLSAPTGEGPVTLTYNAQADTITLDGDTLSVTGAFKGFETTALSFDGGDQALTLGGLRWQTVVLNLGEGFDRVTLGRTGVVYGRVYVSAEDDDAVRVRSDYDYFGNLTLRGVEHLSTT